MKQNNEMKCKRVCFIELNERNWNERFNVVSFSFLRLLNNVMKWRNEAMRDEANGNKTNGMNKGWIERPKECNERNQQH